MTQKFNSKQEAIVNGLLMAERSDLCTVEGGSNERLKLKDILAKPDIKIIEDVAISQFGVPAEDCTVIEFNNENSDPVRIASSKFRNGYDLWLISVDTGMAMRV